MKRNILVLLVLVGIILLVAFPWGSVYRVRAGRERAADEAVLRLGASRFEERRRAVRTLVTLGDSAREAILEALSSPDPEIRLRAASALRTIEREGESASERRHREYQAIVHFGLVEAGALAPGSTRYEVLSVYPGQAAQAAATVARAVEDDALAHRRAVTLLRDLSRPEGAPYLAGLLRRGGFLPSTVHAAAEGLSEFADADMLPDLRAALEGEDRYARRHALKLLGEIGSPEDLVRARAGASDPVPEVRVEAARALWLLGDGEGVLDILVLAQDPEPKVRIAALEALAPIARAPARGAAIRALEDPAPDVRAAALLLLRRRGTRMDGALAAPLLADPSPRVRGEAVRTVADLASVPKAVRAGLLDRSPAVRRIALLSARRLSTEERREALSRSPEERDPYLAALRRSLFGHSRAN